MNASPTMDGYSTLTAPDTVRLERLLPGPIERVWEYLTDSEKRGTWLASGEMDLQPGGSVELIFNHDDLCEDDEAPPEKYGDMTDHDLRMGGEILVCNPPNLLVHTWLDPGSEPSEVSFQLTTQGDDVLLVLEHTKLVKRRDVVGVSGGWHVHVDILDARLRGEEPPRFWATFKKLDAEYEAKIA